MPNMYHYLTFPDQATWETFGWMASDCGQYAIGPNNAFADVVGDNYFEHADGSRELRGGFLVNIAGELTDGMAQYALKDTPKYPKRVFA